MERVSLMALSAASILPATDRVSALETAGAGTSSVLRRLRSRLVSPGSILVLAARRMAGVEIGQGPAEAGETCAKAGVIFFSVYWMMKEVFLWRTSGGRAREALAEAYVRRRDGVFV